MISRLVLNLRILRANLDDSSYHSGGRANPRRAGAIPTKNFVDTLIGNLGEVTDNTKGKEPDAHISPRVDDISLVQFNSGAPSPSEHRPGPPMSLGNVLHGAEEMKDPFWVQAKQLRGS
jgi:hypothetical protein